MALIAQLIVSLGQGKHIVIVDRLKGVKTIGGVTLLLRSVCVIFYI